MLLSACGRIAVGDGRAAELFVIDQLADGRIVAAKRALRVAADFDDAELKGERIVEKKAVDQRLADVEDELEDFGGLDAADGRAHGAEDAGFGTAGDEAGRRRGRVEAAIAPLAGKIGGGLAIE